MSKGLVRILGIDNFSHKESRIGTFPEIVYQNDELLSDLVSYSDCIIHLGAITDTSLAVSDDALRQKNIVNSVILAEKAIEFAKPFIFASSSAVYGNSDNGLVNKSTIAKYALSKMVMEEKIQNLYHLRNSNSGYLGLRFFNVYGYGEFHKNSMISLPAKLVQEAKSTHKITVFVDEEGNSAKRDFVHIDDVVKTVIKLVYQFPNHSNEIVDLGTGKNISVLEIAKYIQSMAPECAIELTQINNPFYQWSTKSIVYDSSKIWTNGEFTDPDQGVYEYVNYLLSLKDFH